jgi:hypothetical protein
MQFPGVDAGDHNDHGQQGHRAGASGYLNAFIEHKAAAK